MAVGVLEERDVPAVVELDLPEFQAHALELRLQGLVVVDAVSGFASPAFGWVPELAGSLDEL